ncbi:MAG TPA: magnesium transporter [Planctomycetaceae bacterium]|nr:magnesium transporter [Planctomycetaceae bacterium]
MFDPLLLPELREMLIENDDAAMREFCNVFHPGVVAENLEALSAADCWRVLSQADLHRRGEIFEFFRRPRQMALVATIDKPHVSALLEVMAPDDRVDLLKKMEQSQIESLLPLVAQAERDDIRKLLSYPEHSAGSIMTTEYASLREDMSVKDALAQLRLQAPNRETIYYVYVIDDARRLRGFVSLRKLILAPLETRVADIMDRDVISVRVEDDQEDVARKIARYDFIAMPVVDDQERLVGIVTHDDVLDVLQQEATEDVHRLGAVQPLTEQYLESDFFTLWYKRATWLSLLFVAELFTFTALAHFESEIAKIVALSLFVPLCISTGGNSGSQAATLITRAVALGQVRLRDWLRVIRHELAMGLALGITLGAIGFVRAWLTPQSILGEANKWLLAAVISQSVAIICLWGTLVGSALPLIFKRVGVDPGVASSPFVATFVDVTGIVIYFSIARIYLL